LLIRGTRDGFGSNVFHSKYDGHSNTLTILKAKRSEFIFGCFTTVEWESSNKLKLDPNAFIFSLTNEDNMPLKMKADSSKQKYDIISGPKYGQSFGAGIDIRI
jgi:hypothetical protein